MRVELLHFEGCPLAPAAHRLVRRCLVALGLPDPVLVHAGDGPSPTVLVTGPTSCARRQSCRTRGCAGSMCRPGDVCWPP